ncbi:MAG TPA: trypsin-like peptidase domain-containing protein [Longimicrobiales bacterium]|nr:trypsin-like peptidase domain-containing protein [Longimicrobiales bacterium]
MLRRGRWLAIALLLTPVVATAQTPAQQQVRQRLGAPGIADTTTAIALSAAFRAAAEQALPAVVYISVEQAPLSARNDQIPPGFRDLLPPGFGPQQPRRGSGSGVIVNADGHILTNNHVVAEASQLTVRLVDGREYRAEVIGGNLETDIAVIKIDPAPGESLPTAPLGDSDNLRVGDWVLALGNPLGLNFTVTAGIVSATGRQISGGDLQLESFIQTDAVINPGNSGGPLIDLFGRVVGINSAIFGSDRFVGYGFAVPITLARRVMTDLLEFGYLRRPQLGVAVQPVTATEAELYELREVRGALITGVQDDLPAQRAGLRIGDIILSVNDTPILDHSDLITRLAGLRPNQEVALGVLRDGRRQEVRVTLGEFPRPDVAAGPAPEPQQEEPEQVLGFAVTALTPQLAQEAGYRGEGGVMVTGQPQGSAANVVARGTIVLAINGRRIRTPGDVREVARGIRPGQPVELRVFDPEMGEVLRVYRTRQ